MKLFKYSRALIFVEKEKMNLQEQDRFYQWMTRVKANSRAASTKDDKIITEVLNGLIVSRPANKVEYLSEPQKTEQEAKVWNLTKDGPILVQESKAASVFVQENKLAEIIRFQRSNGRY